jgi:hypothetical protein
LATSSVAFLISVSMRSSAFTPRPLRPETSTNGLRASSESGAGAWPSSRAVSCDSATISYEKVVRPLGAFRIPDGDERLLQQLLEVRLADVDHVVDVRRAAEGRMRGGALRAARGPQRTARAIDERPVVKVAPEQPQLPELVAMSLPT